MADIKTTKNTLKDIGITLISGHNCIAELPSELLSRGLKKAFIIADTNTYKAAGEKVSALLKDAGIESKSYIFAEKHLEPNESSVGLAIMHFDPSSSVVIGVGSGVINDISKIVANVSGKPYVIVATAPSMDGYASATSSMSVAGLKESLNSKCADVIVADSEILRNAPMEMTLSGLGDMLAKYVAICEWRISALINGEYYREDVAEMVRASLKKCVDNADGLLERDEEATSLVFEGLALCGAAMKIAGCSRPASGVEHYISHVLDMRGEEFKTPVALHGIQCAVGTYIAVGLYEKVRKATPELERALSYNKSFDYSKWAEELKSFLGRGADKMIALEAKEGKYDVDKHSKRIQTIIDNWDKILEIINEELPSLSELDMLYKKLGLSKSLEEIGVDSSILPTVFKATKDIRDKYVLSRLCQDLGIIEEVL